MAKASAEVITTATQADHSPSRMEMEMGSKEEKMVLEEKDKDMARRTATEAASTKIDLRVATTRTEEKVATTRTDRRAVSTRTDREEATKAKETLVATKEEKLTKSRGLTPTKALCPVAVDFRALPRSQAAVPSSPFAIQKKARCKS